MKKVLLSLAAIGMTLSASAATKILYQQDFESITDAAAAGWSFATSAGELTPTDNGKYLKIAVGSTKGGRTATFKFGDIFTANGESLLEDGIYTLKYDFAILNGKTDKYDSSFDVFTNHAPITVDSHGYAKPYKNRDSRLGVTVAVNGEKWPNYLPKDSLETWIGGANSRSVTYGTPTGYYLKKYVNGETKISGSGTTSTTHTWILFRMGQLYLDYAEAMLNYTGSGYAMTEDDVLNMSAAEAINTVRERAGQPNLPEGLGFDEFNKRYENERFVELAFEGHRMFDVRRWMKAPELFTNIKVMEITKVGSEFTYTTVTNPSYITKRTWAGDHQYFWPIPQWEVLKSGALTQNAGW